MALTCGLPLSRLLGTRLAHGGHDVRVGPAAADVAAHALADVRVALSPRLLREAHRAHDLPRCAVAALEAVMGEEGRLHGVERVALGQTLDGGDGLAPLHHRERETGVHPASVHEHGARTTLAHVAALLRAGQPQVLAQ